jgi:hypothetical protein
MAPGFSAGAARLNINPDQAVWLGGYGGRVSPHAGITNDLFVRALALKDPAGEISLVVAMDQLGPNRASIEKMAAELQEKFGLRRERIVLASSHTHSAPVCDRALELAYRMSDELWSRALAYGDFLRSRVVEAAQRALAELAPVELHFGQNVAGFGVNRRRTQPRFRACPAPVDHDVPVLRLIDGAGKVKAIVFGYACHNTTLPFQDICGDYSGFACEQLEKTYPEATCLFVAGCAADINPLPRHRVELARKYGEILAASVEQVVGNSELPELTRPIAAHRVETELALQPLLPEDLKIDPASEDWMQARWSRKWEERLRRGEAPPVQIPYPVQVWNFGEKLCWIQLTAEVCVDYSLRLKKAYGLESTWVSAYTNELVGYVPSERILQEGGYEGGESRIVFDLPAPFAPGVEQRVCDAVDRSVKATRAA